VPGRRSHACNARRPKLAVDLLTRVRGPQYDFDRQRTPQHTRTVETEPRAGASPEASGAASYPLRVPNRFAESVVCRHSCLGQDRFRRAGRLHQRFRLV